MKNDTPRSTPPPLWRTLDRCPGCAGDHLYRVYAGDRQRSLCRSCNRCWELDDDGWARRVDPCTCPGCEWHSTCLSRWDCGAV